MLTLTNAQEKAVKELLKIYYDEKNKVEFKSPTGSGKTFIIANFISQILQNQPTTEKILIFISTMSSADLPKQFKKKLDEYNKFLTFQFNTTLLESPSKKQQNKSKDMEVPIHVRNKEVIVTGKSSFTASSIFFAKGKGGAFLKFLSNLDEPDKYKLIYIRDEAHWGTDLTKFNKKEKNFELKIRERANFILQMSATPKGKFKNQVILSKKDLMNDCLSHNICLLKNKPIENAGLGNKKYDKISNEILIEHALSKFKNIKKEHERAAECQINPAVLIQVDNERKEEKDKFKKELKKLINQIEKKSLSWVIYFGDKTQNKSNLKEDINLENISLNDSPIDVIIFKVGAATGWDIPRACMLLKIRNISSNTLMRQTIGRIMRNPHPELKNNVMLRKSYIYTNKQLPSREIAYYRLQDKFINEEWPKGEIYINKEENSKIEKEYEGWLEGWLEKNKEEIFEKIQSEILQKDNQKLYFIEKKIRSTGKNDAHFTKSIYAEGGMSNAIELYIETQKLVAKYDKFIKPLLLIIKNDYNSYNYIHVLFIIFKYYINEIREGYIELKNKMLNPNYVIQNEKDLLPKDYTIWKSKWTYLNKNNIEPSNDENFEEIKDIYAYRNKNNSEEYIQFLDSYPEKTVMRNIVSNLINDKDKKFVKHIKIIAKLPSLPSDLSFDRFTELKTKTKSFPDFIFKIIINDQNSKYIFMEVKSKADYDENKTKTLIEAYKGYSFNNDHLFFVIVWVCKDFEDRKAEWYKIKCFSNNETLSEINQITDTPYTVIRKVIKSWTEELK